jgi:phage-related baseplate assembly protein
VWFRVRRGRTVTVLARKVSGTDVRVSERSVCPHSNRTEAAEGAMLSMASDELCPASTAADESVQAVVVPPTCPTQRAGGEDARALRCQSAQTR